jgi:hypothetical protein
LLLFEEKRQSSLKMTRNMAELWGKIDEETEKAKYAVVVSCDTENEANSGPYLQNGEKTKRGDF